MNSQFLVFQLSLSPNLRSPANIFNKLLKRVKDKYTSHTNL